MSDDHTIEDLLVAWEDEWQQGRSVSAEELCVDSPELIDRLRNKIQALEQVYSALSPTQSIQDTVSPASPDDWPTPDGFECVEYLGQGGAGIVYKAWQPKLSRFVALKIIRDGGRASPERAKRFRAEATAAQLHHPDIVQIYDVGEYRGSPFLALEYLDGGTLAEAVRGVPQPPRDAATLVARLASAVHYAHGRGIVHRDLKPGNVLLKSSVAESSASGEPNRDDISWASMTPKVADFGIARFLDQPSSITMTGDVMGTPAYMAPEQAEGRTRDISAATDVHALGIILYELLTGRPPFVAPTSMATLHQLRYREATPLTQLQAGIATDLENICLKCLQKEPRNRYATAEALANDLDRFLNGLPVTARPIGRAQRLARWCRRNPVIATLATCLVVAVVAGFALVTWKWIEADRARRLADANFAEIRQTVDDYLVVISEDVLLDEPAMQPLRDRLLTTAVQYYEKFLREHGGDPQLRAELIHIRFKVGKIKALLGDDDQSRHHLKLAAASQRELLEREPRRAQYAATLNAIENERARMLIDAGDLDGAQRLLDDSIVRGTALVDNASLTAEQRLTLAKSHHFLGVIQRRRGQTDSAMQSYQSAVDVARHLVPASTDETQSLAYLANGLVRLGSMQMDHGDYPLARESLETSIGVYKDVLARNPRVLNHQSALSEAHEVMGRLLTRTRRWEAAIASFEQADTLQRRLIKENPQVVRFRMSLWSQLVNCAVALQSQNLEQALAYELEALDLGRELYAQYPQLPGCQSLLALTLHNLGAYYSGLGNAPEAIRAYQEAGPHLQQLVQAFPDDVDYRARLVLNATSLANKYQLAGQSDRAFKSIENAIEQGRIVVQDSPKVIRYQQRLASALQTLGHMQCEIGNSDSGFANLQEAIDRLVPLATGQHESMIAFKSELARTYLTYCSFLLETQDPDAVDRALTSGRDLINELVAHPTTDPDSRLMLAKGLFTLGYVQQRRGQPDAATASYEQAMQIVEPLTHEYPHVTEYQVWLGKTCNNLGNAYHHGSSRSERAEPLLARAIAILEKLNAPATVTQLRRNSLAKAHLNLGAVQRSGGQIDEAVMSFRRAVEIWLELLELSELISARTGLAAAYGNLGHVDWAAGRPDQALPNYNLAMDHLESALTREPQHAQARKFKQNTLWGRARALNKLGRYSDAADDWDQVVRLTPPKSQRLFRMELAWSLAKAGDHRRAVAMAEQLATDNSDQPPILVNCARLFSLAAEALPPETERRAELSAQYAERCLDLLQSAKDLRYFDEPDRITVLKTNADFREMQTHAAFQQFLESLDERRCPLREQTSS